MFERAYGIAVIDADQVARDVVQPGEPALQEIVTAFGESVLDEHGEMDRAVVRDIVFRDPAKRKMLEDILHPRIRTAMGDRISAIDGPYCLLGIPLLAEGRSNPLVDRVLVVDCPETLQIERVMKRDRLTEADAGAIMRAQADRKERLSIADDVIMNDGKPDDLSGQVGALHERYLEISERQDLAR
tara:strand:- start:134 stop:691 length:558 start_codon:yes stop_codon:yes gene_type:complete